MVKKFLILGLVLLLAGLAGFCWVALEKQPKQDKTEPDKPTFNVLADEYLQQYRAHFQATEQEQADAAQDYDHYASSKPERQLQQEQEARLKANLQDLAAEEKGNNRSDHLLYGKDWKETVTEYKAKSELTELIFSVSSVTVLTGLVILVGCLFSRVIYSRIKGKHRGAGDKGNDEASIEESNANREETAEEAAGRSEEVFDGEGENRDEVERAPEQPFIAATGQNGKDTISAIEHLIARHNEQPAISPGTGSGSEVDDTDRNDGRNSSVQTEQRAALSDRSPAVKMLIEQGLDDSCTKLMEPSPIGTEASENAAVEEVAETDEEPASSESEKPGKAEEQTGEVETEDTEQKTPGEASTEAAKSKEAAADKMAGEEFARLAESVQRIALQDTENLNGTLKHLAQQVSAIRDYASEQQQRVKKLQDGYDWNILKNFCLRVIRCIDNLDARIGHFSAEGIDTEHLEEVRDELIFSLESSGVEQFEAEIHSDYRGQEKRLEAVKDKQACDDPSLIGRIAEAIRPGYQYVIDEDNIKIIRAARVRLLG